MQIDPSRSPIFIHSLYRSGSTYLFDVFRKSREKYFCYQEPEHEFLININSNPDVLLKVDSEMSDSLRHPRLEKPYFNEFYEIRDNLKGLFAKSFSFDDFFDIPRGVLSEQQSIYFGALIDHAPERPVLQFCRSSGRISGLKNRFGGVHLHLWREPRNQWWSFKVNNSFDPAVQIIYNAAGIPPALAHIRDHCQICEFHSDIVEDEFSFFRLRPLSSENNYFAFFALWLYSYIEYETHCDHTISIDRLSREKDYRDRALERLATFDIGGLDFSNACVPYTDFTSDEVKFYELIETRVMGIFLLHGYSRKELDKAALARKSVTRSANNTDVTALQSINESRTRAITLRMLDAFSLASANVSELSRKLLHAEHEQSTIRGHLAAAQTSEHERSAKISDMEATIRDFAEQLRLAQTDLIASLKLSEDIQGQLLTATTDLAWLRDHTNLANIEAANALQRAEEKVKDLIAETAANKELADQLSKARAESAENYQLCQSRSDELLTSRAANSRLTEQLCKLDSENRVALDLNETRLNEILSAKVINARLEEQILHSQRDEANAITTANKRLEELLSLKVANALLAERTSLAECKVENLNELASRQCADALQSKDEIWHLQNKLKDLQTEFSAIVNCNEVLERKVELTDTALRASTLELQAIYSSKSWRISRPLRALASRLGKIGEKRMIKGHS